MIKNMQEQLSRKDAAQQFADAIQRLAEDGKIEALEITIKNWDSDKLFDLAQTIGIYKLTVTALSGY